MGVRLVLDCYGVIMESARSWFRKWQPRRDKAKGAAKKKEMEGGKDNQKQACDEAPSNMTKQKVAAAKQYIENHYKAQMKSLQERKERQGFVQRRTVFMILSLTFLFSFFYYAFDSAGFQVR